MCVFQREPFQTLTPDNTGKYHEEFWAVYHWPCHPVSKLELELCSTPSGKPGQMLRVLKINFHVDKCYEEAIHLENYPLTKMCKGEKMTAQDNFSKRLHLLLIEICFFSQLNMFLFSQDMNRWFFLVWFLPNFSLQSIEPSWILICSCSSGEDFKTGQYVVGWTKSALPFHTRKCFLFTEDTLGSQFKRKAALPYFPLKLEQASSHKCQLPIAFVKWNNSGF